MRSKDMLPIILMTLLGAAIIFILALQSPKIDGFRPSKIETHIRAVQFPENKIKTARVDSDKNAPNPNPEAMRMAEGGTSENQLQHPNQFPHASVGR
jgi:hypothetical protein